MNRVTRQNVTRAMLSLALGFFATLFAIVSIVKVTPAIFSLDAKDPLELQRQLRVLQTVQTELKSDFEWDRQDNRVCVRSMATSLFCRLANASVNTVGHYRHDSDAMRIVRTVINNHYPERWTVHPIMDFNNHHNTSRTDLRDVIEESIQVLRTQISETERS